MFSVALYLYVYFFVLFSGFLVFCFIIHFHFKCTHGVPRVFGSNVFILACLQPIVLC